MSTGGNLTVARAVARLFASTEDSDCIIVFCLESANTDSNESATELHPDGNFPAKRQRLDKTEGLGAHGGHLVIGNDLPAHQFILRYASERFATELKRWNPAHKPLALHATDCDPERLSQSRALQGASSRVELRVPLGSEAEVPSARAAIAYAYTGQVDVGRVSEALQVRRQAGYLRIEGCQATCDALMQTLISADPSRQRSSSRRRGGVESGNPTGNGNCTGAAAAMELYDWQELWPDLEVEPSFAGVVTAADEALLRHFGDALAVLSQPALRQELLGLPAEALEALLESDDFGTDTESSVLLLLATWMKENHEDADEETCERLLSHVRLSQLSRPYLTFVLPALAADYECEAALPAGWCPVGVLEAAFVSQYACASAADRQRMATAGGAMYDMESAAFSATPRRQAMPEGGLRFAWYVTQQKLEQAIRASQGSGSACVEVEAELEGGRSAILNGFEWTPVLTVKRDAAFAGVFVRYNFPAALDMEGSRLSSCNNLTALVGTNMELSVSRWRSEVALKPTKVRLHSANSFGLRKLVGVPNALRLENDADHLDRPLAAYKEYLRGGRITGTMTFS